MTATQVGIRCSCGSEKFEVPRNPKASDMIKCARCGASGTYGNVMGQATAQATSIMQRHLKDVFRKAGFK